MATSEWPELKNKAPPTRKPRCSAPGCEDSAFSRGMCSVHYNRAKRRAEKAAKAGAPIAPVGAAPQSEEPAPERERQAPRAEEKAPEVPTGETIKGMIIITMSTLAMTVDESFSVLDKQGNELPHVKDACAQMTPFLEKYAASLAAMSPFIGFGMGIFALAAPAFGPVTEIIAGVRKPRIMRSGPDDVYTDAWKRAQAKRGERAEKNSSGASAQTVEVAKA